MEWVLHEAGYDYENIPQLTQAEVARLMEGRRVDNEIQRMTREAAEHGDGTGTLDGALGRVTPRESDERALADMAARLDRDPAARGGAAPRGGR